MHVGRTYPYLLDRWVVETAFWPGFLPQNVYMEHSALPAIWSPLVLFDEVTGYATPSPSRQNVFWDFLTDDPDVGFAARLFAFNGATDPNEREAAYSLRLWWPGDPAFYDVRAYAISGQRYTTAGLFSFPWTYAVEVNSGVDIPLPGSVPREALWAEVP